MKWQWLAVLVLCGVGSLTACVSDLFGSDKKTTESSVVITATVGNIADSDVNDPNAPYKSNDTSATAQSVHNSATIGGFVSAVGTGRDGDRFANSGDVIDTYRVILAQGQSIRLTISDYRPLQPSAVDLDLRLYEPNASTPVAASECVDTSTEQLTAPTAGAFDVVVIAQGFSISNYVLTIGAEVGVTPCTSLALQHDFVPDEVIVRFKTDFAAAGDVLYGATAVATPQTRMAALGLQVKAGTSFDHPVLVKLPANTDRSVALRTLGIGQRSVLRPESQLPDPVARQKLETIQLVKALRARSDVLSADVNFIRHTFTEPNDPYYPLQWHYPLINLQQAWDITTGSAGIIVAVVDTGVALAHPDLQASLLSTGYDFISDPVNAGDGDGLDSNPDDPGDGLNNGFGTYHGTHVAGTIAAQSNNGSGVAGVAWNTKIMPLRVSGRNSATDYDILQAIRYAARLSNDSTTTPIQKADIINISLGGTGSSATAQQEFDDVRAEGVIVIAAAGNAADNVPNYPAAYDGVISVSAVGPSKTLASYSSFGSTIDVAAPGGEMASGSRYGILSTVVDDRSGVQQMGYTYYQGTSMAAPHVAGVVALMKAIYSTLTPDNLDVLIAAGSLTEDLSGDGAATRNDNFGYGLIDALKAVQQASGLASGNGTLPPVLRVTPNQLDFGRTDTALSVSASNDGGGTLTITNVATENSWLTVTAQSIDANGVGSYQVVVDRSGLPDSRNHSNILFTTGTGIIKVPVTMLVGKELTSGNSGYLYVLLVDAVLQQVIDEQHSAGSGGVYGVNFKDVPAGKFYIVAGTDFDNDGFVCDNGEACGGYPTLGNLETVEASDGKITGIKFNAGFQEDFGLANAQLLGTARTAQSSGIRRDKPLKSIAIDPGK